MLFILPILAIGASVLFIWLGVRQTKIAWLPILASLLPMIVMSIWIALLAAADGLMAFVVATFAVPIPLLIINVQSKFGCGLKYGFDGVAQALYAGWVQFPY